MNNSDNSKENRAAGQVRPTITLTLEPQGKTMEFPRPKTARQLLHALDLYEETALVIRDGSLLTPDRRIWPAERITVRIVTSCG